MTMNVIQIKRSQSNNAPAALSNGELAYSFSSDKLFIGQTTNSNSAVSVEYIGGKLIVDKVANLESRFAGAGDVNVANAVISDTASIATLKLTNFTENGVLFAKGQGIVDFATGTSGKVLQISANGTPVFDDINGGTF